MRIEKVKRLSRASFPYTLIAILAVGAAVVAPVEAQDGPESRWIVRGELNWMLAAGGDEAGDPRLDPPIPEDEILDETLEQTINNGFGVALGVEYLATRHLGVELAALVGNFDGKFQINRDGLVEEPSADIGFTSLTLGLNYHFTPKKKVDYYLGIFFTAYEYDDLTLRFPGHGITVSWTFEDDTGWGWRGGFDWAFKEDSPWVLAFGIRHYRGAIDVHPVMVTVGIGRRF